MGTRVTLSILGGGSWGTALASVLAPRFERLRLWVFEPDLAARMSASRENDVFLPGLRLPENVEIVSDLPAVIDGAGILLGVVPSHYARSLYERVLPTLDPATIFVSATKGLESGTLLRMSQVLEAETNSRFPTVVLSGPSFASEVARGLPTALLAASAHHHAATAVQERFRGAGMRLYVSDDVAGVEVGAALKNVIAIAAGVVEGLGLGHNALAAVITRGLAEISRLACAEGGKRETLAGLSGLGDLVLTCTGELSRNRQVGIELGRGRSLDDILAGMRMVAEGIRTTGAALALGAKHGIELPIAAQMKDVLDGRCSPAEGVAALMGRRQRAEIDG